MRNERGFTLLELMVVVGIITTIAAIAVPNYLGARLSTRETTAVTTIRQIAQAQVHFTNIQACDENLNGIAEYGTFGELCGRVAIRGGKGGTKHLRPVLIGASFWNVSAIGEISRGGYHFRIYLPDAAGNGVLEVGGGGAHPDVDPTRTENLWCVYAWPQSHSSTGRRSFFTNQTGTILWTEDPLYSGPGAPISAGAALIAAGAPESIEGAIAIGEAGRDGNVWKIVGR